MKETKELDLIVIGGGPAGLTAAIYAGRAKLNTLLLEDKILGGQVRNSFVIENYPGFKSVTGGELADLMQAQAEEVGITIDEFDLIQNIILSDEEKIVETESCIYKPKALIVATGAVPKRLPIEKESAYDGRGIHYCAICDGVLYSDKVVAVVGGGSAALEEALYLSKIAKQVYIIRRHDYFKAEQSVIDNVYKNDKIKVLLNQDLVDIKGDGCVETAVVRNTKTGEISELALSAIFGYIGTEPKTENVKDYIDITDKGYIITNEDMETNIKGVYAAGDVRDKKYRQITTAVSDGTIAALNAEKYILEK